MSDNITLREWLAKLNNGDFDNRDRETMCDAGWYDWFCKDEGLFGRFKRLAPKVKRIAKSSKINPDTMYVWFKNNCPCFGDKKLCDDFRFADMETGDVMYTVTPRDPYGNAEVWGRENEFNGAIVSGTMQDVYNFFGV